MRKVLITIIASMLVGLTVWAGGDQMFGYNNIGLLNLWLPNDTDTGIFLRDTSLNVLIGGETTTTDAILEVQGDFAVTGNASTTGNSFFGGTATTTGDQYIGNQLYLSNENGVYDKIYHGTSYILNGMSEDKQSLYTIVEGGEVYLETEKIGGGDIEYTFNEKASILDCTTGSGTDGRARVLLTQGLVDDPQMNYVYVTDGSGIATLQSSTSFPSGSISMVATIAIGDDVRTTSDGPAHLQRWTMSLKHDNGNNFTGDVSGTLYWMQRKLRALGAHYEDGIALTTDNTGGIIDLTAGGGNVSQLHPQTWPSRQISVDGIYVANASGSGTLGVWDKLMDLSTIDEIQDGTTITNNRYFGVDVWGSMNSSDQNGNQSKLYFNLPTGFYLSADDAIADSNNYAVRTVPSEFSTTAFLIGHLTMQRTVAGNVFVGNGVYSLLGQALGSQGGGAGSTDSNTFSDAQWLIENDTDPTKQGTFDLSSVTTGQVRDIIWPDANGTMCLLEATQTFTALQTFQSGLISQASSTITGLTTQTSTTTQNMYIPQSSSCSPVIAGEMCIDTTSDQFKYYGGGERVLSYKKEKCFTLESPTTTDDNVPIWSPEQAVTITDMYCRVEGGTSASIFLSDGTNAMDTMMCSTSGQADDGSIANNTLTANERLEFDTTAVSGTVDWINFCYSYVITAD